MIAPVLKNEAFLHDVMNTARDLSDSFRVWWLGQSGFLIQWSGHHLLMDPYLSDSLTRKYASTDKPHVRMTELVIAPEQLRFIDVVSSSHNHTDHLDADTLIPLLKVNPKLEIVIPEANREFVSNRLNIVADVPIGLDAGKSARAGVFHFHGIASAHENIDRDEAGLCKYLGYVVEFGQWAIYHSGDTVLYPQLAENVKAWRIDLALLPINGAAPERRVAGNLNGREAAALAKQIGAAMVIPCHYEMFEFNTASTAEFEREARRLNQPYTLLKAGQRWSSPPR